MKQFIISSLFVLCIFCFAIDENNDHNYSPGLSKRAEDDTESSKDYVGYSDESSFGSFDLEKSNTYKMSVAPPVGGTFISGSLCNGEVTKDDANLVEGKKIYSKGTIPTATYIIEMSGQVGFSGKEGGRASWGAYVRNKYFWLTPNEQIVRPGVAVTITSHGTDCDNATWNISASGASGVSLPNGDWISGGAKKKSQSITLNHSLWADFNISENDPVPSAGIYNITASLTSPSRSSVAKIYVMDAQLISVDFSGAGNHELFKTGDDSWTNDKYEDNGNFLVDYAEWQDSNGDGIPEMTEPVCYTKNSTPRMQIVLSVVGAPTEEIPAKLRVKLGSEVIVTKDFSISGGSTVVDNILWDTALPNYVANQNYVLTWELSIDEGNSFFEIGSTTNSFFITYDTPRGSPETTKRINWSTLKANRSHDQEECADAIQTAVSQETRFSFTGESDSWSLLDGGAGDCDNQARCMMRVLGMLGIPGEVRLVRASTDAGAGNCLDFEKRGTVFTRQYLLMDFTPTGDNHSWNQFEGCCYAANNYYAITPKRKAPDDYSMLKSLSCRQYWATIETDSYGNWNVVSCEGPIPIP